MKNAYVILGIFALLTFVPFVRADDLLVYFGTHVSGPGKGFSVSHFDTETGMLSPPKFLREAESPGYFVFDAAGKHLYTCHSSMAQFKDQGGGGISSYTVDQKDGSLKLINSQPSMGEDPSFISLDKTGHYAFVANYQGGNICAYAINPDGSLGARTAFDQHTGKGTDPARQNKPYAHSIRVDPTNHFVLSCDLGLDKVFIYKFDAATGALTANVPAFGTVLAGSGSRHLSWSKDGKFLYVDSEMGSIVTVFSWDSKAGKLTEAQSLSTLPVDFTGTNTDAEVLVHPSGRFLYVSNRGHNSIAEFTIDTATGKLTHSQDISSAGKTPRNFEFDPSGKWMIVTNHDSNNAVIFSIDQSTGRLAQKGEPVEVPYPFCPRFLKLPG